MSIDSHLHICSRDDVGRRLLNTWYVCWMCPESVIAVDESSCSTMERGWMQHKKWFLCGGVCLNLSHPLSVLDFASIARPFAFPHNANHELFDRTAVMEIVLAIQGKDYVLTYTFFRT